MWPWEKSLHLWFNKENIATLKLYFFILNEELCVFLLLLSFSFFRLHKQLCVRVCVCDIHVTSVSLRPQVGCRFSSRCASFVVKLTLLAAKIVRKEERAVYNEHPQHPLPQSCPVHTNLLEGIKTGASPFSLLADGPLRPKEELWHFLAV